MKTGSILKKIMYHQHQLFTYMVLKSHSNFTLQIGNKFLGKIKILNS